MSDEKNSASPGAVTPTPTHVNDKTCPFKQGFRYDTRVGLNTTDNLQKCNRDGCQLWVDARQDRVMIGDKIRFADPEYEYVYTGCGLIHVVPWQLHKKEAKQQ